MSVIEAKVLDETHLELSEPLPGRTGSRVEVRISIDPPHTLEQPAAESSSDRPVRGTRLREREEAWCRSNPEALRQFEGQWVVLEGEEIVAHGQDPAQLVETARAKGVRIPYVFFVEKPRSGVVRLWL